MLLLGGLVIALAMSRPKVRARVLPMGEEKWSQAEKIASLDPAFRAKVERILARLRAQGWRPFVVFGWRSLATQRTIQGDGRSELSFSFHNAVKADAAGNVNPSALAADIADERYLWGTRPDGTQDPAKEAKAAAFFHAMLIEAKREGITTGGTWSQRDPWKKYGLGWDPGHLQMGNLGGLAKVREVSLPLLDRVRS
jgi:hypothetical protein